MMWQEAMVEEYDSIMKNQIWEVVLRPQGKKVVGSKSIQKVKHTVDECVEEYKEIFMEKGFSQKDGINYEEAFSNFSRNSSIRAIIYLAAQMCW